MGPQVSSARRSRRLAPRQFQHSGGTMIGYFGLLDVGHPKAGEIVVISRAASPTHG